MQLRELDTLLVSLLSQEHPEILSAVALNKEHSRHSRVRIEFASGARATIQVRTVEGPKVPTHKPYEIPAEVV